MDEKMKEIDGVTLTISREPGANYENQKLDGYGYWNPVSRKFDFEVKAKRVRSGTRSTHEYDGNIVHMLLRPDGSRLVKMELPLGVQIAEIRELIRTEIDKCLEKIR